MALGEPWLLIVLAGAAIAGWGLLLPRTERASPLADGSFERLLEDLEAENRELLEAVAKLKKEQDETLERLGNRIRELERDMDAWRERARAAETAAQASPADVPPDLTAESSAPEAQPAGPISPPAAKPAAPAGPSPQANGATAVRQAPVVTVKGPAGGTVAAGDDVTGDAAGNATGDGAGDAAGAPAAATIRGRYAELLDMYDRGRSIEQIARALNMNKGEVQLILQLAKREEAARA